MLLPQDIILKPVVSEKSTGLMEGNKYTFLVAMRANKLEIKRAVEQLFHVTVLKVNTMRVHGKLRRQGKTQGRKPDRRKAIVTLKPGDKIEIIEGL